MTYRELVFALRAYLEMGGVSQSDVDNIVDGILNDLLEAIEEANKDD